MKIYEQEKAIANLIVDNSTSTINLPINIISENNTEFNKSIAKIKTNNKESKLNKVIASIDTTHPDLMYGSAILCSTIMNKNDDVFLPSDTWMARKTPVNTPFNDNHVENEIIGHTIATRCKAANGDLIPECTCPDGECDCPCPVDYFDIESDFVVYKSIFPGIASEIMDKGPKGEKFVSMECVFSNFDYALFDNSMNMSIVSRNESTAFLTKHLRMYGGSGYFDGSKIGRVLRNFRFTGMGSVDVPANPSSEYTKLSTTNYKYLTTEDAKKLECKSSSKSSLLLNTSKGKIMEILNLEDAKTLIANLNEEIDQLKAAVNKNQVQTLENEVAELKEKISALSNDNVAANSKLDIAEKQIEQKNKEIKDIQDLLDQTKAELQSKTEAILKSEAEAKKNARIAKIAELNVDLDNEKREKLIALSDEAFSSVLEFSNSFKKNDGTTTQVDTTASNSQAQSDASQVLDTAVSNDQTSSADIVDQASDNNDDDDSDKKSYARLVEVLRKRKPVKK